MGVGKARYFNKCADKNGVPPKARLSLPLLKALFELASRLPLPLLHAMGILLGWGAYVCSKRFRRALNANLARAGYTSARLKRMAIGEIGKSFMELPVVWMRPLRQVADLVRETTGWEHITQAHAQGRPIVFLTPHLGCFEITAQVYAFRAPLAKPITVLYRRPRTAALTSLIEERQRKKLKLAPADLSGVRALMRALKRGEAAGLLPDQTPRFGEGVWAPFFGKPAFTMTLPGRLVRSSGALLLLAHAERLAWGRGYKLEVRPFEGAMSENLDQAAAQLNAALETLIRQCPAQYLWTYERYRTPRGVAAPGNAMPGNVAAVPAAPVASTTNLGAEAIADASASAKASARARTP